MIEKFENIKSQKIFLLILFLIFTIGFYFFTNEDKNDLFFKIFYLKTKNPILDLFLSYITKLGNYYFYIFLILFLSIKGTNFKIVFQFILSLFMISFFIYISKNIMFKNNLRPYQIFDLNLNIYNINFEKSGSFPSGHSAVIFSMITLFIFVGNTKWYFSLLLLLIAILVSYSRIYLAQHFFEDVLVGAFIGILSSIISNIFILSYQKHYLLEYNLQKLTFKFWKNLNRLK